MIRKEDVRGNLALDLFDLGSVKTEGYHRLKRHESEPQAPLSPLFFNLRTRENPKPGPLKPEDVSAIGQALWYHSHKIETPFDALCGLPRAGEPFAQEMAIRFAAFNRGKTVITLIKEETAEKRRIARLPEGVTVAGLHVLMVDDLITGADTKLEALDVLRAAGAVVTDCLVLIDREQRGKKELEEHACKLHSVFGNRELLEFYLSQGRISRDKFDEIIRYLAENP